VGKYEDKARQRLGQLLRSRKLKQEPLAQAVGHSQSWMSNYLQGTQGADLDELAKMVAVFDLPLTALFDEWSSPQETDVLALFRALPPHRQKMLLELVQDWVMPPDYPRGRRRPR
jgi:transcriptional regulator with XRE-family HTH domain